MFRNWFKPLGKRNARFASVVIGILCLFFVIDVIKELFAGASFEEIKSSIIMVVFFVIIEYAMIIIATSKDDPEENAENKTSEDQGSEELESLYEDPEAAELKKLEDKYKD